MKKAGFLLLLGTAALAIAVQSAGQDQGEYEIGLTAFSQGRWADSIAAFQKSLESMTYGRQARYELRGGGDTLYMPWLWIGLAASELGDCALVAEAFRKAGVNQPRRRKDRKQFEQLRESDAACKPQDLPTLLAERQLRRIDASQRELSSRLGEDDFRDLKAIRPDIDEEAQRILSATELLTEPLRNRQFSDLDLAQVDRQVVNLELRFKALNEALSEFRDGPQSSESERSEGSEDAQGGEVLEEAPLEHREVASGGGGQKEAPPEALVLNPRDPTSRNPNLDVLDSLAPPIHEPVNPVATKSALESGEPDQSDPEVLIPDVRRHLVEVAQEFTEGNYGEVLVRLGELRTIEIDERRPDWLLREVLFAAATFRQSRIVKDGLEREELEALDSAVSRIKRVSPDFSPRAAVFSPGFVALFGHSESSELAADTSP